MSDNGAPGEALEYWMKAGDVEATARLTAALTFPAYMRGRVATVERWFGWLEDHGAMENHPAVAVLAAMVPAMTGKPADAERRAAARRAGSRRRGPAGREPVDRAVAGAAAGAAVPGRGGPDAGRRGARGQDHGRRELLAGRGAAVPGRWRT